MHIILCFNCSQRRICTCTRSLSSTLVSSSKREATTSCKICCGRPLVDGIGSVSSGMMSTVGLELTSFINPDWTWKTVSKRNRSGTRRTRKLIANSLTIGKGIADKNARTTEDATVSDSEKVGVDVLGRRFSEKVENVPIKKRRIMFQSPSPPPPMNPYPHHEASEKHVDFQPAPDQSFCSSASKWQQLMKSECSTKNVASIGDEKISKVINGVEDFSGIEILAAAACSDTICNDATEYKGNQLVEESTQERNQSSASSIHLEETGASLETACCFPKDSVNERKPEGSSFQDSSSAVLHEFPSEKSTTQERFVPLLDDRLLWDLNVSIDAWPCDGGNIDSQKDSFGNISVRSEELQTKEPEDINNNATKEVVSSDIDGGNRMTSDLRTMPVGTDDLSMEKQESEGCLGYKSQKDSFDAISVSGEELQTKEPQDIQNDTTDEEVSSDVDGDNRMASDLRTMPVGTDDLSTEKQESKGCSGCDPQKDSFDTLSLRSEELQTNEPQDIKTDTTNEVASSDVDGGNRMTSDLRTLAVGTDDLTSEKQESKGCSGYGFQKDSFDTISVTSEELQSKESQDIKTDTTKEVVSSDVDGGNRMTSDLRTMLVGTDDLATEKQESERCSGYDSPKDSFDAISVRSEELQTRELQDLKNDTANDVVVSDVEGGNRMTSDLRTMPVGTDDLSTEKQEPEGCSAIDSKKDSFDTISVRSEELQAKELEDLRNDTTNEVFSSDVGGGNKMTSDVRTMPVGTDDLNTEKQESEGCSGQDSQKDFFDTISVKSEALRTKEPQNFKTDTNPVFSSDVDRGNGMTSDLQTMLVGTDDLITGKHESEGCSGYDSQFEDGELRESDVHCWEEAEQVDYDTEFEEERSFGLEAESGEQELKVERVSNPELIGNFQCSETGEALRKNSVSLKIRTVEVSDGETMKIDCLDGSNYDLRVDLSKVSKREFLSCVEGSLSSDVRRSRFDNFNGSYPRAERGAGPDKFMGSYRSSHMRGRSPEGGAQFFNPSSNYWDSKRPHPPIYHAYNFGRPRPKRVLENQEYSMGTDHAPLEAACVARPDHSFTRQYMGSYRPLVRRRSPVERDDSYNMHPRIPTVRDTSPDRNRFRRYPQVSRGIREEYLRHIPDDSTRYMNRMPHHLDRRERSISPHGGRPHHTVPYRRPRSRSRSRSPIDWLLQRDRNEGSRRRNRSPDFRSDARMDRVRLPFTKRFAAGYGEFGSPPRSRGSPQRNSRMFEDRNPGFDHFRGRKSHVRMIRQDQRFDQLRPIRRLNSNNYFNPMIRPRRFPDRAAGGKGCKDEVSDEGKHDSRYAMINRVRCYDTDVGARRFRFNEEDSYMAKNSLPMTDTTGVSSRHPDDADPPRTASEDR